MATLSARGVDRDRQLEQLVVLDGAERGDVVAALPHELQRPGQASSSRRSTSSIVFAVRAPRACRGDPPAV